MKKEGQRDGAKKVERHVKSILDQILWTWNPIAGIQELLAHNLPNSPEEHSALCGESTDNAAAILPAASQYCNLATPR